MKKVIGIALMLAVVATLCFGGVALAADPPEGVHTEWEFNGEGEINIHTEKTSDGCWDNFHLNCSGSGSKGWQDVSATLIHPSSWTDFRIERHVKFEGSTVDTFTVRENLNPSWPAHTEYGAYIDAGSDGYGELYQSFFNTHGVGGMETYLYADCPYDIGAWVDGSVFCDFYFDIGANGDGWGGLYLNMTDNSGYRTLRGEFHLDAESDAGFYAEWDRYAVFGGNVQTPSIDEGFNVNVNGSGYFNQDASASWVIIDGFINRMR